MSKRLGIRAARRRVWEALEQTLQNDLDVGAGYILSDDERHTATMEKAVNQVAHIIQTRYLNGVKKDPTRDRH